jgi:tetratricopeptide (TPR) repeat protein
MANKREKQCQVEKKDGLNKYINLLKNRCHLNIDGLCNQLDIPRTTFYNIRTSYEWLNAKYVDCLIEFISEKLNRNIQTIREDIGYALKNESEDEKHFKVVSEIWDEEFTELENDYWINIKAQKIAHKLEYLDCDLPLIEELKECVRSNKNVMLLGPFGSGKTFTFFNLFLHYKNKLQNSKTDFNEVIPWFLKLNLLKNESLENYIKGSLNETTFNNKRYLIFLDGLNEDRNLSKQLKLFDEIVYYSKKNLKKRIFVSSRSFDRYFINFKDFNIYRIKHIGKKEQLDYLKKRIDQNNTTDSIELFLDNLHNYMGFFITTPLFLKYTTYIYNNKKQSKIDTPKIFFQKLEEYLFKKLKMKSEVKEYQKVFICFLANKMIEINETTISLVKLDQILLEFKKFSLNRWKNIDESKLIEILEKELGFIKKIGENVEFAHPSLQSFLAALQFKTILEERKNVSVLKILTKHSKSKYLNKVMKIIGFTFYLNNIEDNETAIENNSFDCLKYLISISDQNYSKLIIKKILKKDIYQGCELFSWSSITKYDEKLFKFILENIDVNLKKFEDSNEIIILLCFKILEIIKNNRIINPYISSICYHTLGKFHVRNDRKESVSKYFKLALSGYKELDDWGQVANCYNYLGILSFDVSKIQEALTFHNTAEDILSKKNLQNHVEMGFTLHRKAIINEELNKKELQIEYLKKALLVYNKHKNILHSMMGKFYCYKILGDIYYKDDLYTDAIRYYKKAIQTYNNNMALTEENYIDCLSNLTEIYLKKSRYKAAKKYRKKLYEKRPRIIGFVQQDNLEEEQTLAD